MSFISIPGLTFNGKQVGYDDGAVVTQSPPPPPTQSPPPPASTFVFPAILSGRTPIGNTSLPFIPWKDTATNRKVSPSKLNDTNFWLLHFTTGPSVNPRPLRIQAAEYPIDGSQAVPRHAMLFRDRDNVLLAQQNGNTVTFCPAYAGQISYPAPGSIMETYYKNMYPLVEVNTAYTICIWNQLGVNASTMLCELYL